MTLEIRQLVLKSSIGELEDDEQEDGGGKPQTPVMGGSVADEEERRERLKEEILAECRSLLLAQLQQLRER
jgi:hypothetical protein